MNWLTLEEVITIHDRMLEVGGGRKGIRDFTLLHSAIERPKVTFNGKFLYPTLWLQTAALIHSLIKNHPFEDGNKRTAYFSAMRFLNKNGYELYAPPKTLVKFVLNIENNKFSLEEIARWLKRYSKKNE